MGYGNSIFNFLGISIGGYLFYSIIVGIIGIVVSLVVFFTVFYPAMKDAKNNMPTVRPYPPQNMPYMPSIPLMPNMPNMPSMPMGHM